MWGIDEAATSGTLDHPYWGVTVQPYISKLLGQKAAKFVGHTADPIESATYGQIAQLSD